MPHPFLIPESLTLGLKTPEMKGVPGDPEPETLLEGLAQSSEWS